MRAAPLSGSRERSSPALDMFDSHCHLDDERFDPDRDAVLTRAARAGVTDLLLAGVRPSRFSRLWATAEIASAVRVHVSLGIHPQVVPELTADERALVPRLASVLGRAGSRPVAIGECGLDGPTGQREEQETVFRAQIRAARELALPLVLHVFRAHEAALRILADERAAEVGGIAHSFSGSAELVCRYLDLGFALSFAGPVTWTGARKPRAAAARVPRDALLVETDAPDQAPQSARGQRNEPARLPEVVAALAAARGETREQVAAQTSLNTRRILRLP